MVDFHDRRNKQYGDVNDIAGRLPLQDGDTLAKTVLNGRYVVRGRKTDAGREFVLHEAIPNGAVIERGTFPTRYAAHKAADTLPPTQTYGL